ncbi:MAG TPA: winged helix DNA-binding domain-containing protein [Solirubrobacteraceae bacterium]|nr:winged helix DNA-binding domain-containing protein [Solirubrobacteraceae bacterium]
MRKITAQERRRALVRRHHLAGDANGPEAVVRALIALHATDPASVYLSVLARSATTTLSDVADAMYERRSLVRWMAMRRTLFVFAREDIPIVQAAVSIAIAATLRRRLITQLERNGSEPPIERDIAGWLDELGTGVETVLTRRGAATGTQLAADEPGLRTRILARTASERAHNLTTRLLTLMSTEGRLVRGTPTGTWTSRQHRWEPVARWWPEGLPALDPAQAQRDLARRWLARFGPARTDDLQWWTGWNTTTTRRALEHLALEEVDLHGQPGIDLPNPDRRLADETPDEPVAALLPTLDPTPMGWKTRNWFLGIDPAHVFDPAGNIGPTLWWNGEIVGSWTITPGGELRWEVIADRGAEAHSAIEQAASRLHRRLHGAVVTPAIRAPLERALTDRHGGRNT